MLPKKQAYFIFAHKWIKKRNLDLSRRFLSSKIQKEAKVRSNLSFFFIREKWKSTVGLEVHAQIATKSKLFSSASTNFASAINSCVSLFDCATPGTLPVLNRKCVELTVLASLALSCQLNEISFFERKHYFYADLPAGFQITQQRQPIAVNGEIKFHVYTPGIHKSSYLKSSKIKQIQIEQDSGKSLHDEDAARSFIDLNRAGIPLMEFVFEPDLVDGEEAAALVKELVFIYSNWVLAVARWKKEHFVSMPMFLHISVLENNGEIFNETRAWDAENKRTVLMREKEEKEDYRFIPETNLPPLRIHVREDLPNKDKLVDAVELKKQLPELPEQIRQRLRDAFKIPPEIVVSLMVNLNNYYLKDMKRRILHQDFIGQIINLLQDKLINLVTAKRILDNLTTDCKKSPREIVKEHNWFLISDEKQLEQICLGVIEKNPKLYRHIKMAKRNCLMHYWEKLQRSRSNVQIWLLLQK
ncbi:hypothetical protein DMN91_000344 [Ooceraea biroi]|uniref:Glutamyl-tRNA(Gln) amidotransferase subunit B, mitochondrial n=1 Tax=Ooceraea biroi TaxID=2015173 RepID=A0A3L8E3K6_OOCBI|nr:hypothetical protein DMN91_000344 [Ooceraea biroi]